MIKDLSQAKKERKLTTKQDWLLAALSLITRKQIKIQHKSELKAFQHSNEDEQMRSCGAGEEKEVYKEIKAVDNSDCIGVNEDIIRKVIQKLQDLFTVDPMKKSESDISVI